MPSPVRLSAAPTDVDIIEAMRKPDSFMDITPSHTRKMLRTVHAQTLSLHVLMSRCALEAIENDQLSFFLRA